MHPFNCLVYYQCNKLALLVVEGLSRGWPIVPYLHSKVYVFNIVHWNLRPEHLDQFVQQWSEHSAFDITTNLIWLMNTTEQVMWARERGLKAIFVNHNAWLDERLFRVELGPRPYRAVINARPFNWKRVYLADKIDGLAWIQGSNWRLTKAESEVDVDGDVNALWKSDPWHWNPWYRAYEYVNLEPISTENVVKVLNKSMVGLCLSGHTGPDPQGDLEGACYSSSEYLLCGLPVVSTECQGGREVWYTKDNSVVCPPDCKSVEKAVRQLTERLSFRQIDRQKIRSDHIALQEKMRQSFITETGLIFMKHGVRINPVQHFRQMFRHKMTDYATTVDKIVEVITSE